MKENEFEFLGQTNYNFHQLFRFFDKENNNIIYLSHMTGCADVSISVIKKDNNESSN